MTVDGKLPKFFNQMAINLKLAFKMNFLAFVGLFKLPHFDVIEGQLYIIKCQILAKNIYLDF